MEFTESRMKQNSTAKEKSLNPQTNARSSQQPLVSSDNLDERIIAAVQAAAEKKAIDIVL